jgi:hypothetical protein
VDGSGRVATCAGTVDGRGVVCTGARAPCVCLRSTWLALGERGSL